MFNTVNHLAQSASTAPDPSPGSAVAVLAAAAVLLLAFAAMRRAVGPFVEILKAALYAVSTFLLILVAVILLLISLIR